VIEFLLHGIPVLFAVGSFWSNTERKLLILNLGLCVAIASLLVFEQAWGGVVTIVVAGLSTSYRLITQRLLHATTTYAILFFMTLIVAAINNMTGNTGLIELMPVLTFMLYRFGELHCKEVGLRICIALGSLNFSTYGVLTETWGLAITEGLFVVSNVWYLIKLRKGMAVSAV